MPVIVLGGRDLLTFHAEKPLADHKAAYYRAGLRYEEKRFVIVAVRGKRAKVLKGGARLGLKSGEVYPVDEALEAVGKYVGGGGG